ncbi:hypothetical protein F2Q70_00004003 [Brassica cretica]|uniref:Uncharacterized protein n=1 Tax=Brassica cretica TaxID=69181 RepID=A0A8S9IPF0_BRACR|nr:hypothetical protein F2Q70_00004003 [Brassica cretica]
MARRPSLRHPVPRCDELEGHFPSGLLDFSAESNEWGYSPCQSAFLHIQGVMIWCENPFLLLGPVWEPKFTPSISVIGGKSGNPNFP